jgi:CubicO group peptidase (beta-lactamase class C family)
VDPVIDPLAPRLDALAAKFVVEQRLPGLAAGVVRDGALAWTSTLGFADRASRRPVTPSTLFRIASITKSFTATAILQLRDEGRLRLDDPLVVHVPEARAIADPYGPIEELTLRRMLTHASGLQNDVPLGDDLWQVSLYTPDELVARLDRVEVLTRPETGWRYSNLAYELLGVVVSRVAGEAFETYVQRAILDPAGLTATAHFPAGDLAERCATGYGPRRHEDDVRVSDPYDSGRLLADGGLWSTVEDLARWLTIHSRISDEDRRGDGDRVLDGRTLREMQHPASFSDWTYAQGLGWATRRIGEDPWVGHTGSLNGFRAIALFRPKDRLGVIALTNGSARPAFAMEVATLVLEAHRAVPPAVPAAPPAATPVAWRELVGTYQDDDYGYGVRIEVRDGALVLAYTDDPAEPAALAATDDPLMFRFAEGEWIGEQIRFLRNAAGAIAGVNVVGGPLRKLAPIER